MPVAGSRDDLGKHDRRNNNKDPSNQHNELCAHEGEQTGDGVETDAETDSVDDVTAGCDQGGVLEDVLEGEGGEKDHDVVGGCDTGDDDHRSAEANRAPDTERHNGVFNTALPEDEEDQESNTDEEGSQSMRRTPTSSGRLGEVVDNGDDTEHEGDNTNNIDTTIDDMDIIIGLGDDKEAEDAEERRDDGGDVEDPVPANGRVKDTTEEDTDGLTDTGCSSEHREGKCALRAEGVGCG